MSSDPDEQRALKDLYLTSYSPLVGVLTLAAGSREDAEEIAQDAFVRLITHWPQVSGFDDPEAWLRKVSFRLLTDRRRRAARVAKLWPSPGHNKLTDLGTDGALDIERALDALPINHRQVILLHYLYDLKVSQVAELLGLRVGTVKSRLARARTAMATALDTKVIHDV